MEEQGTLGLVRLDVASYVPKSGAKGEGLSQIRAGAGDVIKDVVAAEETGPGSPAPRPVPKAPVGIAAPQPVLLAAGTRSGGSGPATPTRPLSRADAVSRAMAAPRTSVNATAPAATGASGACCDTASAAAVAPLDAPSPAVAAHASRSESLAASSKPDGGAATGSATASSDESASRFAKFLSAPLRTQVVASLLGRKTEPEGMSPPLPSSESEDGSRLSRAEAKKLKEAALAHRDQLRRDNLRTIKWATMLSSPEWAAAWEVLAIEHYGATSSTSPPTWPPSAAALKKWEHVKARCRKGIPDSVRCLAWPRLANVAAFRDAHPQGLYRQLLSLPFLSSRKATTAGGGAAQPAASTDAVTAAATIPDFVSPVTGKPLGGTSIETVEAIERDVSRTFPSESLFAETGGLGQTSLFRLLVAYAQFCPEVGYCQGMGHVAALCLSYFAEEDAFWLFVALLHGRRFALAQLYKPGLPHMGLRMHQLKGLLGAKLPKLAARLEAAYVQPPMYAAQWVMTALTYTLPFGSLVRVWDSFLCEGWKVLFRVYIVLLKLVEEALPGGGSGAPDLEACMSAFRSVTDTVLPALPASELVDAAWGLSLQTAAVDALATEWVHQETAAAGSRSGAPPPPVLPCSLQALTGQALA